jgi:hypothetical protein
VRRRLGSDQHVTAISAGLALRASERWRIAPALTAATAGVSPQTGTYNLWHYAYTPLTFSIEF